MSSRNELPPLGPTGDVIYRGNVPTGTWDHLAALAVDLGAHVPPPLASTLPGYAPPEEAILASKLDFREAGVAVGSSDRTGNLVWFGLVRQFLRWCAPDGDELYNIRKGTIPFTVRFLRHSEPDAPHWLLEDVGDLDVTTLDEYYRAVRQRLEDTKEKPGRVMGTGLGPQSLPVMDWIIRTKLAAGSEELS